MSFLLEVFCQTVYDFSLFVDRMSLKRKSYDVTYKVLVLGESTVGKTALIKNHCDRDKEFNPNLVPTIGKNQTINFLDSCFQCRYLCMKSF